MVLTQLYFHTLFFEELEITRRIGERSLFYSFLIYPHELSYSTSGPKNGKENYILSRVGKQEKKTLPFIISFSSFSLLGPGPKIVQNLGWLKLVMKMMLVISLITLEGHRSQNLGINAFCSSYHPLLAKTLIFWHNFCFSWTPLPRLHQKQGIISHHLFIPTVNSLEVGT